MLRETRFREKASDARQEVQSCRGQPRRLQLSLRWLMVSVAIICVYLGVWYWIGQYKARRAEQDLFDTESLFQPFSYQRVFDLPEQQAQVIFQRYADASSQREWFPEQETLVYAEPGFTKKLGVESTWPAMELGCVFRRDDKVIRHAAHICQGLQFSRVSALERSRVKLVYTIDDEPAGFDDIEPGRVWTAEIELKELIAFLTSVQHNPRWINERGAKIRWLQERSTATGEVRVEEAESPAEQVE